MADQVITAQKLIDADKDATSLDAFINGGDSATVTTRKLRTYPSLAKAVKQVMETGGFEPFATEAALLASIPTLTKKAAKALDTKKVWLWDGTKWNDTGLSEYDLSIKHTNTVLKNSITFDKDNMLDNADKIIGKYLHIGSLIADQKNTAYAVVSVKSGEYFFKNYNASLELNTGFLVGFSATANAAKYDILERKYIGNGLIKVNVLADGYLAFNILLNNIDYINTLHLSQTLRNASKNVIQLSGAKISDVELRSTAITKDNIATVGNIYNINNNIEGLYVSTVDAGIRESTGTALGIIEVSPGETYDVKSQGLSSSAFQIALKDNAEMVVGTTLGIVPLSSISTTHKQFTVPTDSPAKYAFFSVKLNSISLDVSKTLYISKKQIDAQKIKVSGIDGMHIAASTLNKLTGKRWIAIGDSLTEKNFRTNKNYHDYVSEDVGGMVVYNKGISGSGFHDRMDVADTLVEEADIITLMFGINDYSLVRNEYLLGEFLSTDTQTISGRMNLCLSKLIEKYPFARIGIMSSTPVLNNYGSNPPKNRMGYSLKDHADLLKGYAAHFSLPFLNLYECSNLPVWIPAANQYYFTAPGLTTPDGGHPNDAGQRVMADKIKAFLESI